jgi:serine/threonine-protein kinase HipA
VPSKLKYENDGGPGMAKCLQLLSVGGYPQQDTSTFVLTQLSFWLMAATDGHAKNYSIFLDPGDSYAMTPLYDILSMWPYFGKGQNQFTRKRAGLAMALRSRNAHYALDTIQTRHWHELAMKYGGTTTWDAMLTLVANVPVALAAVERRLPKAFPGNVWDAICAGMKREAQRFESGLASL